MTADYLDTVARLSEALCIVREAITEGDLDHALGTINNALVFDRDTIATASIDSPLKPAKPDKADQ